jgi:arabinose-5-phosphate isomerase
MPAAAPHPNAPRPTAPGADFDFAASGRRVLEVETRGLVALTARIDGAFSDACRLLLHITDVMHGGDEIPRVHADASLSDALLEMSRKHLGLTAVVDADNRLLGLYTDGDLRRTLDDVAIDLRKTRIDAVMTRTPKSIGSDALAVEAARMMEAHKINALLVVDADGRVVGALNIHDLLRARVV